MPLTPKELAMIIAALKYWRDEMEPHDPDVARPYFEGLGSDPLSTNELEVLLDRLVGHFGSESKS